MIARAALLLGERCRVDRGRGRGGFGGTFVVPRVNRNCGLTRMESERGDGGRLMRSRVGARVLVGTRGTFVPRSPYWIGWCSLGFRLVETRRLFVVRPGLFEGL